MSWPLALPVGGRVLCLDGPGGFALVPAATDSTIDALLAAARARPTAGGVAWVPASGGLLSNLPAWENLVLATQWHVPASLAALEARIRAWCTLLGHDEATAAALLARQPAWLDDEQRLTVGWLRVLLARPKLVLLEGQALPAGGTPLRRLVAEELHSAALLVVDGSVPAGFAPVSFHQPGNPVP